MKDYRVHLTYVTRQGRPGRYVGFWHSQLQNVVDRYAARGCTDFRWRAVYGPKRREGWMVISPSDL